MVIEDLVAVDRLLPLGDRGSRRYVPESVQSDSAAARWQDQVLLLVSRHTERFETADDAGAAVAAGTLGPPISHVLLEAASLTAVSAVLHSPS